MTEIDKHIVELSEYGFTIIDSIYSTGQIENITATIDKAYTTKETFRKSTDLFAIRQLLKELPELTTLIFSERITSIIRQFFGADYFVVKSIYFDKPETSNWSVAYHQDLTISVDKRVELENFGPWTTKQNQFAVQPPLYILQNIYTVRIHLDHTDEQNGALKVIPASHQKGIYRPETINWAHERETICVVPQGGIMIMKPLLLHSSNKTTNNKKRRVIHIEFSNLELPSEINWAERIE